MSVGNILVRVFQTLLALVVISTEIHSRCKKTYVTKCENFSDIPRYGEQTWKNLIIAKDECSGDVSGPPSEVLNFRTFNKTPSLEELYIVEKLVDIQPGAFDGLHKLSYLKLYKNVFKVIPKGVFSNLKLLKLDLQDNSVENIQHGLFENSAINWIDLSNNKLNNLQVDMVALASLKKLVITHNDISLLVPHCFHENLEHLNLDNNNISEIEEDVLKNLKNLKELILSNNKLKAILISYGLPSLEKLDLSHNQIQGIQDGSFKEFFDLKSLHLGYNRISYLNANIFPAENVIEVVHLHHNALMSLDERVGTILPSLKEMSIGGNPWTCPCLEKITQYFEQKKIRQPECDREFFASGLSAVCWVVSDTCTGSERPTQEIANEFQQALKYYNC